MLFYAYNRDITCRLKRAQEGTIPVNSAGNPLFDDIQDADRDALLNCLNAYTRTYHKGELLPMDTAERRDVGIILTGALNMVKEDVWGRQSLIARLGEGALFGEGTALDPENKTQINFLAATNVTALYLPFERVLHPCQRQCPFHTTIARNMFRLMGVKNAQLMDKIEVASQSSLREKILCYLKQLAQKQGGKYIIVPLNRTEMASYLQSNRSAMTRELSDMQAEGLIDFDGNTFVLKS